MFSNYHSRLRLVPFIASCVLVLGLSGCKGGRIDAVALGLAGAPDEFNIRTNDHLIVPKNTTALPTPDANSPDLQESKVHAKVDRILGVEKNSELTASERALLQQTGGLTASNKIRTVITQERISTLKTKDQRTGFFDKFRSADDQELGDVVLDTSAENQTLAGNGLKNASQKHKLRRIRQGLPAQIF
jgi:hypothetical protein